MPLRVIFKERNVLRRNCKGDCVLKICDRKEAALAKSYLLSPF